MFDLPHSWQTWDKFIRKWWIWIDLDLSSTCRDVSTVDWHPNSPGRAWNTAKEQSWLVSGLPGWLPDWLPGCWQDIWLARLFGWLVCMTAIMWLNKFNSNQMIPFQRLLLGYHGYLFLTHVSFWSEGFCSKLSLERWVRLVPTGSASKHYRMEPLGKVLKSSI